MDEKISDLEITSFSVIFLNSDAVSISGKTVNHIHNNRKEVQNILKEKISSSPEVNSRGIYISDISGISKNRPCLDFPYVFPKGKEDCFIYDSGSRNVDSFMDVIASGYSNVVINTALISEIEEIEEILELCEFCMLGIEEGCKNILYELKKLNDSYPSLKGIINYNGYMNSLMNEYNVYNPVYNPNLTVRNKEVRQILEFPVLDKPDALQQSNMGHNSNLGIDSVKDTDTNKKNDMYKKYKNNLEDYFSGNIYDFLYPSHYSKDSSDYHHHNHNSDKENSSLFKNLSHELLIEKRR